MTCLECNKELGYIDHREAMETLGLELCKRHKKRIDKLIKTNNTPVAAIQLYYGLKAEGESPMLEWWDGSKFVDLAFSRVKLNIEIDDKYEKLTDKQAINHLQEVMHSFKNGFTTIKIPHTLVANHLKETVDNILGIMEGLRANIKVI
ncbi:MAG: hypothetical protein ACR2MM_07110 [Flavobacteriaceae bacterium]